MAKRKRAVTPAPSPEASPTPEPSPSPEPEPVKKKTKTATKSKPASTPAAKKTVIKGTKRASAKTKSIADDEPPGFKSWLTGTKLAQGGKLNGQESQYNPAVTKFTQVVEVHNSDAFTLKPLTLTAEGPYQGYHVLMLMPVQATKYFRFLDLPPELRKMVYDLLLQESGPITIDSYKPVNLPRRPVRLGLRNKYNHKGLQWDKLSGKWQGQKPSNFSLLRVNKQLRDEAAAFVYGDHTFNFYSMSDALVFVETVGSMAKYLRQLDLASCGYMSTKATPLLELLKDAKGLRALTVAHSTVCSSRTIYYYGRKHVTPERFVHECAPLLAALHEERKAADNEANVLDILQIETDFTLNNCLQCSQGRTDNCNKHRCGVECKDVAAHCEKVVANIRRMIAEKLNVED